MIARRGLVRGTADLFALLDEVDAAGLTGALVFEDLAKLYLVEGELYCAEVAGSPDLVELLVESAALTPSEARLLRRRGEQMLSHSTGVARAQVGLDRPVCHATIRRLIEDVVLHLANVEAIGFQFDPYDVHPLNVVVSWSVPVIQAPVRLALVLGAVHARGLVGEPVGGALVPGAAVGDAGLGAHDLASDTTSGRLRLVAAAGDAPVGVAPTETLTAAPAAAEAESPRKAALRRLIGAIRRL